MAKLSAEARDELDKGSFTLPRQRKQPLENVGHVGNALARFNQVKDVGGDESDAGWIIAAAIKHGIEIKEKSWREIGKG